MIGLGESRNKNETTLHKRAKEARAQSQQAVKPLEEVLTEIEKKIQEATEKGSGLKELRIDW